MLGFRNAIEAFRWLTLIPMFCRPTWRRFIDTLVFIGKIAEANYGVQWTAPKFESVDPLKDAMAELKKIRTGTLDAVRGDRTERLRPREAVARNQADQRVARRVQDHPGLRPAQRERQGRRAAHQQRRGDAGMPSRSRQ